MMRRTAIAASILFLLIGLAALPVFAQATGGGADGAPEALAPLIFVLPFMLFWGIYMLMIPVIMLLSIASWVFAGLAIYDCVLRDFEDRSSQGLWCVLIFLTRWIGVIIYYFAVYRPDKPPRT